jgi:hypothetical protein
MTRLEEVGKKSAAARVGLEGDAETNVALDKISAKLIRLDRYDAESKVTAGGAARMIAELSAINLELDKINGKKATAEVNVRGGFGGIAGRLFSGGGGGASGSGGLLSALPAASGLANPYTIGAAVLGGLVALPGLAGLGIGGGVGALAVGGSLAAGSALAARVKAAEAAVRAAQRKTAPAGALGAAQAQLASAQALAAPFTVLTGSVHQFGNTVLTVFGQTVGPILKPIAGIFAELGRQVTALSPQLTAMFKASLPFIRMFADVMAQSGKILIPAFTQAMTAMVKSGALQQMSQALVILIKGLAQFIVDLGPGMRSSAMIFKDVATIINWSLRAIGVSAGWLANAFENTFHWIRLRIHDTASLFDSFRHGTANTFNALRHDIAAIWDALWNNTIGRAIRGVADVTHWFGTLPGRISAAVGNAGRVLSGWGAGVINGLLAGVRSVWNSVLGFFKSIPGAILHALGIKSPPQWAIDAGMHIMNGLGLGMNRAKSSVWNASSGVAGIVIAGAQGGPTSASASQAQAYARSRLGAYGWGPGEMGALIALWNQESGWNRFARNPSSGAYGIPQALPASKMGAAANPPTSSAAAQINWGLSYIAGRYGSPSAAESHELAFHWYDQGGWLPPGLSLAYNGLGRPERVGGGGGNTYITLNVNVPRGVNGRQVGAELVGYIKEFEKGSGSGWRK